MKTFQFLLLLFALSSSSCKQDFLDQKSDQRLVVPSSISDFQAILDDRLRTMRPTACELGIVGADEFTISSSVWEKLPISAGYQKNAYIWADDVYQGEQGIDWNKAYKRILYANIALEGIEKIKPSPVEENNWNNVKGSGLFFRAISFYQLAQLFCKAYVPGSTENEMGIPLRLSSDILIKSSRSSLKETYDQIFTDLKAAAALLPLKPVSKYRPSKAAAYALLARAYLQIQDYQQAYYFSDLCLNIHAELIDYNSSNLALAYPFPANPELNPEVIFHIALDNIPITGVTRINMDEELLRLYHPDDLRYQAFFKSNADGRINFKGSYSGSSICFIGLATDEVLLTRAECLIRLDRLFEASADLRQLIKNRYTSSYQAQLPIDQAALLQLVLEERRKELILRGTRWEDLRRLNQDPVFAKTLRRIINGKGYELSPNSARYVWPIPDNVIQLSGIAQNIR